MKPNRILDSTLIPGMDVLAHLTEVRSVLKRCRSSKTLKIKNEFDQCPATINTTLRRLELLLPYLRGPSINVLILGDDDLLGLAIAVSGLRVDLTILDIDSVILEQTRRWAKPGTAALVQHDLRCKLPDQLFGRFDVVFTDPPYTLFGQLLFLKRAISALRREAVTSAFICTSRLYLDGQAFSTIVASAKRAGLELKARYKDFNRYRSPSDVAADIRGQGKKRRISEFESDLLHFVTGTCAVDSNQIAEPSPYKVYDYGDHVTGKIHSDYN